MGITERKERDFRRREEDILQAALRLFDQDNWQDVTIEQIAQEAEIGKGTVYLHFPSKEEIYAHLHAEFGRKLLAQLRAIDPSLSVEEQLRGMIRVVFDHHLAAPSYRRVFHYCERGDFRRGLAPSTQRELERIDGEFGQMVDRLLQRGVREGVFADRPLPVLLFAAHSTVVGALHSIESGCLGETLPDDYIEELTRFVVGGLKHMDKVSLPRS
jgi:AcrR family transcriptional regulator